MCVRVWKYPNISRFEIFLKFWFLDKKIKKRKEKKEKQKEKEKKKNEEKD